MCQDAAAGVWFGVLNATLRMSSGKASVMGPW